MGIVSPSSRDWIRFFFTGKPHIFSAKKLWFPIDLPLNQSIDIHVEKEYRIWNYHELPTGISQSLDPKSYGMSWMPFHSRQPHDRSRKKCHKSQLVPATKWIYIYICVCVCYDCYVIVRFEVIIRVHSPSNPVVPVT